MKRFLLVAGSSLCLLSPAQAQIGLRAGGSLSALHNTDGDVYHTDLHSRAGYQVGVLYQLPLAKRLALVPEVQYSAERTQLTQNSYSVSDVGFSNAYNLRLAYLNVPVLVRATLGPVYVEAGPQAGVLVGGRQAGTETTSSWQSPPATVAVDRAATARYRRFDIGPCVGVGLKLPAGLGLSVRAYRGLVSLTPSQQAAYSGNLYRQTLQASLTASLR